MATTAVGEDGKTVHYIENSRYQNQSQQSRCAPEYRYGTHEALKERDLQQHRPNPCKKVLQSPGRLSKIIKERFDEVAKRKYTVLYGKYQLKVQKEEEPQRETVLIFL